MSNIVQLKEIKARTYGELLREHLEDLTDEEKAMTCTSILVVLNSDESGLGYINLVEASPYALIGMLDCAKTLVWVSNRVDVCDDD